MTPLRTVGCLLALAISSSGCVAHSSVMRPVPAAQGDVAPSEELATVVFIRPSAWFPAVLVPVIDGEGHVLGEAESNSRFAVALPPGEHVFVAWRENTAALHAYLAPGKIYYVEISPRPGFLQPRVQLLAIKPSMGNWPKLADWLSTTTVFVFDPTRNASVDPSDVDDHLRSGLEQLHNYDAAEIDDRTIREDDGR
jgi:hypothetical protein